MQSFITREKSNSSLIALLTVKHDISHSAKLSNFIFQQSEEIIDVVRVQEEIDAIESELQKITVSLKDYLQELEL